MPTPLTTIETGVPHPHWQGHPLPPAITVFLFVRQLPPPSLEPIKRIQNLCTRNHPLNTLAILLLCKNNPATTRRPAEVSSAPASLALPGSLGLPGSALSHLVARSVRWGRASKQRWSRWCEEGTRPEYWHQIRSQRKEWKPSCFIYFHFWWRKPYLYIFGHSSPYFLFSPEQLTVRVALETPPWPLGLQCDTLGLQEVLPVSWPTRDHGPSW